jgi:hypothetical protein
MGSIASAQTNFGAAVPNQQIHIECSDNPDQIYQLEKFIPVVETGLLPLRTKRDKGELTIEENDTLLYTELKLIESMLTLKVRYYYQHFCLHPEHLEQQKSKPPDIGI